MRSGAFRWQLKFSKRYSPTCYWVLHLNYMSQKLRNKYSCCLQPLKFIKRYKHEELLPVIFLSIIGLVSSQIRACTSLKYQPGISLSSQRDYGLDSQVFVCMEVKHIEKHRYLYKFYQQYPYSVSQPNDLFKIV